MARKMSSQDGGAQKKTMSFHIKLMKIYLIPGFIDKAW